MSGHLSSSPVLLGMIAAGAVGLLGAPASSVRAATLLNDDFTNAVRVGSPNSVSGVDRDGGTSNDYVVSSQSTTVATGTLASDVGPGIAGNSFFITNNATASAILTKFSPTTLANVGDFITLSFDFRKAGAAPGTASQSFRFGLFDQGAASLAANTSNFTDATFDGDTGYQIRVTNGASNISAQGFSRDGGTAANIFAGTVVGTGGAVSGGSALVGDTNYAASITLTLTAANTVQLSGSVAGVSLAGPSNTDTVMPLTTFDTAGFFFSSAWGNGTTPAANFIDNVVVTSSVPVPEPTSLTLGGLLGAGLLARRRRGASR